MKNILLNLKKFQTILHSIFDLLFFGNEEIKPKSTIVFDVYINAERQTLINALSAFELKKQGGV